MVSDRAIERWMSLEVGRINAGLVLEKKTLAGLLKEPKPSCRTREGEEHTFDRGILERLASLLTEEETRTLRLPITLFVAGEVEDSAYLTDSLAANVLRGLESFGTAFPYRDGRMYLPHSLALDLVRRSGGAVQLAFI